MVRGGLPPQWIGRHTNELGFNFFPKTYEWIGRHTNALEYTQWIGVQPFFGGEDLRMNWKTYEWIGVPTFFGGEDIRMNWKTYEWIGRHTNEFGFRLFFFGRHSFVSKGNHSYVGLLFFFFFSVLTCLCTKALHFSHFRGGAKGRPAVPPLPPRTIIIISRK